MHWTTKGDTEWDNCRWKEKFYSRCFTVNYIFFFENISNQLPQVQKK